MQITLSTEDIQRLSPSSRAEILQLLGWPMEETFAASQLASAGVDEAGEIEEVINEEKQVVSLDAAEAKDLLANVSEKSKKTLKLFAQNQVVPMSELVGDGKFYDKQIQLKQSLVGAVNRRLRTVTSNRNAALFSSDRNQTRIKVTGRTARSLRRALQMPEPLPQLKFYDKFGQTLDPNSPDCKKLKTQMEKVWTKRITDSFPESEEEGLFATLSHFLANDYHLWGLDIEGWHPDEDEPRYETRMIDCAKPLSAENLARYQATVGFLLLSPSRDALILAQPIL